jgi:hypothetical protein
MVTGSSDQAKAVNDLRRRPEHGVRIRDPIVTILRQLRLYARYFVSLVESGDDDCVGTMLN